MANRKEDGSQMSIHDTVEQILQQRAQDVADSERRAAQRSQRVTQRIIETKGPALEGRQALLKELWALGGMTEIEELTGGVMYEITADIEKETILNSPDAIKGSGEWVGFILPPRHSEEGTVSPDLEMELIKKTGKITGNEVKHDNRPSFKVTYTAAHYLSVEGGSRTKLPFTEPFVGAQRDPHGLRVGIATAIIDHAITTIHPPRPR